MNKKALIIAGTASMISQFNMINIDVLQSQGYKIEIACDFHNGNNIDENEKIRFRQELKEKEIRIHQIDFSRHVSNIFGHIKAYNQIKKIRDNNDYKIVHCHMPIVAFLTRLCFKKERNKGTVVMYTAHGFHFFNGAPLKNWILYYPLEKIASSWTDVLILINKEDYELAKNKFNAKNVVYTPGVGVDINRFSNCSVNREEKRKELNITSEKFVLLSIGELIEKKNQKIVIESINKLNNKDIVYLIVGIGEDKEKLENLINKYNLQENIKLLGYRKDVDEICKASDCFIHTATREGLGIAPLEAMASGLVLISSNCNGIRDYTENNKTGICVNPNLLEEIANAIDRIYSNKEFRDTCGKYNKEIVKNFSSEKTKKIIEKVYRTVGNNG